MSSASAPVKPQSGSNTTVQLPVQDVWKHTTVIVATIMAIIPIVIAALVQLKDVPGLPTNVLGWIASAVSVLTAIFVIYQKINGIISITPTAAAKLMPPVNQGNNTETNYVR